MFENSTVNISALCNSCEDMAYCLSECVLTFLYAGDNIQYVLETVRTCTRNISFLSTILRLYIQIALSRKPFGIGHMFI